jgi:hypothetical protein
VDNSSTEDRRKRSKIDDAMPTSEALSGRGGLSLFVRYLTGIGIFPHLERLFGSMRRNKKGRPVSEIFKQLLCFFMDGSSRHLSHFDRLREDDGYVRTIESEETLSSHAVKRFFGSFWWPRIYLFRRLLQKLFLWRLHLEKPQAIVLGIDVVVLDNDDARRRHGVKPTYKKVKGFAPLQMNWGRFVIDAVFRSGDKHSNHSDTVAKMVEHVVGQIRKHYREDVPIVLRSDSGFFDQKLFECFEGLGIGYICAGKLLKDLRELPGKLEGWRRYQRKKTVWEYVELGDKRGTWKRFRRLIYCRKVSENQQLLCDFARNHTLFYTNLGRGERVDERLREVGLSHLMDPEQIIRDYHDRGRDELVNRAMKDFAFEEMPFKRFAQNAAFYYTMLLSFFLYESFKEDVCAPAIAINAYPTTFRRKIIDIAVKVIRHAGKVILKVPEAIWNHLHFEELWRRSAQPPIFAWM